MVRWLRWHRPPDTGFEIRALVVWDWVRYFSVTEAPHNTEFHTWMGKKHFCFFQTAETGNRASNSSVKGSGANHYPRAPTEVEWNHHWANVWSLLFVLAIFSSQFCTISKYFDANNYSSNIYKKKKKFLPKYQKPLCKHWDLFQDDPDSGGWEGGGGGGCISIQRIPF